MYRRRFNKKDVEFNDNSSFTYRGKPDGDNDVDVLLNRKFMKELPKSSYSFAADPYEAAAETSKPLPPINKFNPVTGTNYGGEANIDGGNAQQYVSSYSTLWLKVVDCIRTKIGVNYRYIQGTPQSGNYPGKYLIDEMRKAIAESVSILKATTFTQMAINSFVVETDMPMGSAESTEYRIGGTDENPINIRIYEKTTDVLYAMAMFYQQFLQEGLSTINSYNAFRTRQGQMMRMSWNRETPQLRGLFGLFNKSSFRSLIDSICLSFEGEYIDVDFMKQYNTFSMITSKRSNSILDPTLEIQSSFNHCSKFKVYIKSSDGTLITTPLFDFERDLGDLGDSAIDGSVKKDFFDVCSDIKDFLSMEATLYWARNEYNNNSLENDKARYNHVELRFNALARAFSIFKPLWTDFREAFDVMVRTGTISWTKGFRPTVIKETDAPEVWNTMIDHVYQLIYSGANKVTFDDDTKRWRTFSLWNMYTGIPEYDQTNGGAFLTLSFKEFDGEQDTDLVYNYLPILFNNLTFNGSVTCAAVTRDGKEIAITRTVETMRSNPVLSRLAPLSSQSQLQIALPTVRLQEGITDDYKSTLYKTLSQIFGMAKIEVVEDTYDYSLDSDIIAIYQMELADITNAAITYARANAPFRGTSSEAGIIGFASFTK